MNIEATTLIFASGGLLPLPVSPDAVSCNQDQVQRQTDAEKTDHRVLLRCRHIGRGLFRLGGNFLAHGE